MIVFAFLFAVLGLLAFGVALERIWQYDLWHRWPKRPKRERLS